MGKRHIFMKTKILRNTLLTLGAGLAAVLAPVAANAQNLYVTLGFPAFAIYEYTPGGVQSTYASGLPVPRGLAFDSLGNLFAAENPEPDNIDIGRVLKFNLRNKVSTVGSVAYFIFEGLATDSAGNVFVTGINTFPRGPFTSTIFKFTPSGDRIVFGSVPGQEYGLAFDSAGNLYAAADDFLGDSNDQTIYKFAPNGARTVFAGPSDFAAGAYPIGLAFDSGGNLFVSTECFCEPGSDTILKFTPTGVESTFATGLTNPRGLGFDGSGNLFVAENIDFPNGDILEYPPGGGAPTVFASGLGRPQFLTFGPPR